MKMFAVLLSIGLASAQDPASELFHVTINGADKTNKLSFEDSTNNQVVFASDSGSNQVIYICRPGPVANYFDL